MSIAEIQSATAELSEKERGNLVTWLLDSLPPHGNDNANDESVCEAERRLQEIESGKTALLGEDDFWNSVHHERSQWK
jgi:putative addiction module component (TIGR02574 family)